MTTHITIYKNEDLRSLISGQLKIFCELGFHEAIGKSQEEFHDFCLASVDRKIPEMLEAGEGQMPVLLVFSHDFLSRKKQMELLGIESNYINPLRDIIEVENIPSSKPYLIYRAEYGPRISISPWQAVQISKETQPLTFDQGLAILAQAKELRNLCQGMYFAGSYWHLYGLEQTPYFTSLNGERRIVGHYRPGGGCASYATCAKREIIFSPGSGEGSIAEASREA